MSLLRLMVKSKSLIAMMLGSKAHGVGEALEYIAIFVESHSAGKRIRVSCIYEMGLT